MLTVNSWMASTGAIVADPVPLAPPRTISPPSVQPVQPAAKPPGFLGVIADAHPITPTTAATTLAQQVLAAHPPTPPAPAPVAAPKVAAPAPVKTVAPTYPKLPDGTLARTAETHAVYAIWQGKRTLMPDAATFEKYFGKPGWSRIVDYPGAQVYALPQATLAEFAAAHKPYAPPPNVAPSAPVAATDKQQRATNAVSVTNQPGFISPAQLKTDAPKLSAPGVVKQETPTSTTAASKTANVKRYAVAAAVVVVLWLLLR